MKRIRISSERNKENDYKIHNISMIIENLSLETRRKKRNVIDETN